jgi:RNA polymerase sigma-70 factor (ECF subfamily)
VGGQDASEQMTTRRVSRAVRRAQAGDFEAFAYLYVRYADDIYSYVCSIVHDSHEAEDLTQQVFAKLIRGIGKYEEREVPFAAWVVRVARNLAVDHLRRQRSVPVEEVRAASDGGRDLDNRHRANDLREALEDLPRDQCEVLVLRHVAGLSPREIATRTGRSEGSIHGLHHRGRKALKLELTSRGLAPATMRSSRPTVFSGDR